MHIIKNFLLLLCLGLLSNNATAKWIYVTAASDSVRYYVDASTIRKNANIVKMWDLQDESAATANNKPLSVASQSEYDCKAETSKRITATAYSANMGMGEALYSAPSSEWKPLVPESIGWRLWEVACGKYSISEAALSDSTSNKWTLIDSTPDQDVYLDLSGINSDTKQRVNKTKARAATLLRIWEITDYKVPQVIVGRAHFSIKTQFEYSCELNTMRGPLKLASYTGKMGTGNVVGQFDSSPTENPWQFIIPGSYEAYKIKVACGKVSPTSYIPARTSSDETQIDAAIARNPDLSYWLKNDLRLYDEAVKVDEKLRVDDRFKNVSYDERFKEVVKIVKEKTKGKD